MKKLKLEAVKKTFTKIQDHFKGWNEDFLGGPAVKTFLQGRSFPVDGPTSSKPSCHN